MKTFKIMLALLVTLMVLSGCSRRETSRLYFDSKPYHYLTGMSSDANYDLLLYRIDGEQRFYLQEKNSDYSEITGEIWGAWEDRNGILNLMTEDNKSVRISGYKSTPHVIHTDIPKLGSTTFQVSKKLYLYKGTEEKDGYTYNFTLRLFEKGKTIPIYLIPPKHQENTFILDVEEVKDGEVVSQEEFIGYWNIKERIMFLKMEDDLMHFKTQRNKLELISYENRYGLDGIHLEKIR